jgi:hypothetical protein
MCRNGLIRLFDDEAQEITSLVNSDNPEYLPISHFTSSFYCFREISNTYVTDSGNN